MRYLVLSPLLQWTVGSYIFCSGPEKATDLEREGSDYPEYPRAATAIGVFPEQSQEAGAPTVLEWEASKTWPILGF